MQSPHLEALQGWPTTTPLSFHSIVKQSLGLNALPGFSAEVEFAIPRTPLRYKNKIIQRPVGSSGGLKPLPEESTWQH